MSRYPVSSRVSPENFSNTNVGFHRRTKRGVELGYYAPPNKERVNLQKLYVDRVIQKLEINFSDYDVDETAPIAPTPEIIRSIPEPYRHLERGPEDGELEPRLPVDDYTETILDSVAHNQVTIITAETGAGKSTRVPRILALAGYNVSMTQPRILSANLVGQRIQDEFSSYLGSTADNLVAVHTSRENTVVDGQTRITVLTDGLRLVQEYGQRQELEHEVLIIDEMHERNENIDMLMAKVKELMKLKPELRVIIMSATMQAAKTANYFDDGLKQPPIIEIPGRNFEVERSEEPASNIVEQAVKYAEDGHNILIFLPGVREIEDAMAAIHAGLLAKGITNATILPLHSKLSKTEQEAVMGHYPGPKIICATNIAQTSITVPDVTVVLMSGLERRNELDAEGVQSLNLRPVSRADLNQQSGRCGRVEDGIAVLTRMNGDAPFIANDSHERTDYPIPEILRTDVDRLVLLAASNGDDFAQLDFLDPVDPISIERSKTALRVLGALDEDDNITARGLRMVRFPMRPMHARMLTYCEDVGYSANVRTYMAAVVSSMEVGGLPSWLRDSSRDWRNHVNQANDSDHLSQLDLFITAQSLPEADRDQLGLDVHNTDKAEMLYSRVCKRFGVAVNYQLDPPNDEERLQMRHAIAAGMIDFTYSESGDGYTRAGLDATHSDGTRLLGSRTTLVGRPPRIVVAHPVNYEKRRGHGPEATVTNERLIQNTTGVTAEIMGKVAVELCTWRDDGLRWKRNRLQRIQREFFNHSLPTGSVRYAEAAPTADAVDEVERYVMINSGSALTKLKECKKSLEHLQQLTTDRLPAVTQDNLQAIIRVSMDGEDGKILDPDYIDNRIREIVDDQRLQLDNLISPADRQKIYDNAPKVVQIDGQTYKLNYSHGVASLRVEDPIVALDWPDTLRLPDGRPIRLLYKHQAYSSSELVELAERLVLNV